MHITETKRKKTAFFGGTFDPIHMGHLSLLHEANLFTDYERIIISPVFISNFKQDFKSTSAKDRVAMLKIALEEYKSLFPKDCVELVLDTKESESEKISYSIDTVEDIYKRYDIEGKLGFFIGDDILPTLSKWKSFSKLKDLVQFTCFTRHNIDAEVEGAKIVKINSRVYEASSTDIRNGDLSTLTKGVREYVKAHELYRS